VPYLAGRFGITDDMRVIPGAEGRATAAEAFRRLYWDTAALRPRAVRPYPIRLVNWFGSK